MRKSALILLSLAGLLALAGCSAAPAASISATSSPQPTTAPTPTSTAIIASHCPQLPAAQPGQPPAAPPSLYASHAGTALAALNLSDGAARWQDTLDPNGLVTAAQVANNVVYAAVSYGTSDGFLVALNASDGHMRWCISLEPLISNPYGAQWNQLAIDGQTIYIAGSEAGSLRAINASDGTERWHAFATGTVAALAAANGRVYVSGTQAPSSPTLIMALDNSDGHTIWSVQPQYSPDGPLAVVAGVVYTSEQNSQGGSGFLDALSASDGALRWRVPEGQYTDSSQPAVADNTVYIANTSGIAAFAASNGARRWQDQPLGVEMVGPAAANGSIYLAWVDSNEQPHVGALSASTGQQQWQMPLDDSPPGTQAPPQLRPALNMTSGKMLNSIEVLNGMVVVSYIALTSNGDAATIADFDARTALKHWIAQGVLLAAG